MNKKNFDLLVGSMNEAGDVVRGKRKASRVWKVEGGRRFECKEDVQSLRKEFGVSQTAFAKFMGISVNTLQNWEQGRRQPTGSAKVLLSIAFRKPKLFFDTVAEDYPVLMQA